MQGSGGGGGKIKWPSGQNLVKMGNLGYSKGIERFITSLPKMLGAEIGSRGTFDPQAIQHQLDLQKKFGSQFYGQQIGALQQLDPQGFNARNNLLNLSSNYAQTPSAFETRALGDLRSGYALPPDFAQELNSQIRGAQAARGNTEGNAPVSAEAIYKGKAALDLYQQRMQNAMQASQLQGNRMQPLQQAINSQGPIQQISQIQPVTADRPFAFMNPNAGYMGMQGAQNAFQNYLGMNAANMQPGQNNGAGWGSIISSVLPILASVAFSDRRLKKDIKKVGETPGGNKVYSFRYKTDKMPKLYGVMADEIKRRNPNAVVRHPSGYDMVDYSQVT